MNYEDFAQGWADTQERNYQRRLSRQSKHEAWTEEQVEEVQECLRTGKFSHEVPDGSGGYTALANLLLNYLEGSNDPDGFLVHYSDKLLEGEYYDQ